MRRGRFRAGSQSWIDGWQLVYRLGCGGAFSQDHPSVVQPHASMMMDAILEPGRPILSASCGQACMVRIARTRARSYGEAMTVMPSTIVPVVAMAGSGFELLVWRRLLPSASRRMLLARR